MELLHCLLPSLHLLHLDSYDLLLSEHRLTLSLTSTQTQAACPICGQLSHRVHSRYERTLTDLPYVAFSLILIVRVCKFFCSNPDCCRRIFTERLPEVATPLGQKNNPVCPAATVNRASTWRCSRCSLRCSYKIHNLRQYASEPDRQTQTP